MISDLHVGSFVSEKLPGCLWTAGLPSSLPSLLYGFTILL